MDTSRARACTGKVQHRSERAAIVALAGSIAVYHDPTLVTYRCQYCRCWHVGHPPKRLQQPVLSRQMLALVARVAKSKSLC